MKINNLYEAEDYKQALNLLIEQEQEKRKGVRTALAEACQCQSSYISRVLNRDAHLSLEQIIAAADFFGMDSLERDFLILLVQRDRAGTHSLKQYFEERLALFLENMRFQKRHRRVAEAITDDEWSIYYSDWLYSTLHVALAVPALQNATALCEYLDLERDRVMPVLQWLVEKGFADKDGSRFFLTKRDVHLPENSPLLRMHHLNWRFHAMRSYTGKRQPDTVHFSSVFSLSKADITKIYELVLENLREVSGVVEQSAEEEVYSLCIDYFPIQPRQKG